MNARYNMRIVTDFAAAHLLRGYEGPCSRLHGHNWKVEVEVMARALDEVGMGLDFKLIKDSTRRLVGDLDHRNLNDIPPFDEVNPTAENIAAYLYRGLSDELNDERVKVSAVTLWETERACVRYTED
ncbi:MAG TPA: 6-carboxytetrahydropterin synthase QueD [Gammaproteobacteria bacterium]|nr:6-carboxytetrahydropterin synthase QueD [Gammaproteobacteria bacterium]